MKLKQNVAITPRVVTAPVQVRDKRILPMSSPRRARVPSHRTHIRRDTRSLLRRLLGSACAGWVASWLPRHSAIRIGGIAATVLAVFFATNLIYHVMRKPTEMFFPVSAALNKMAA